MYQPLITFCPHPAIFTQVLDYLVNSFLFLLFFKHGITTNHSFSHCFLVYDMGRSSYLFVFQEDKE